MRLIITCIVLIFICKPANAQNAFYDAKKISQLLNPSADTATIKSAIATSLSYFTGSDGKTDFAAYEKFFDPAITKKVFDFLLGEKKGVKEICTFISRRPNNSRPAIAELGVFCDSISNQQNIASQKKSSLDSLDTEISTSKQQESTLSKELDELRSIRRWLDSVISEAIDTSRSPAFLEAERKLRQRDTSTVLIELRTAKAQILAIDSLRDLVSKEFNQLNKKIIKASTAIVSAFEALSPADLAIFAGRELQQLLVATRYEVGQLKKDIAFTAFKELTGADIQPQLSGETASLTNFRMPTQTEMIDALAIYIARRFKQEVALSLLSELKAMLNKYPLLKEFFPETMRLFNNNDLFEIPRFGKMWHHAISEDFIKMPDNIKNSVYIESLLKKLVLSNQHYLVFKDVVTLANWTLQKNALPEIVSLYKADPSELHSPYIKQCLDVLHLVNTELSDLDPKRYWISWKEFTEMKPEEFKILLTLLERDYEALFKVLNVGLPSEWKTNYAVHSQKVRSYFNKALIILNNFQTTQQQYLQKLSVDPNTPYTGISFWDFQHNLFTVLLNKDIIQLPEKATQVLNIIQRSINIYKLIEKKDYAAMIHETIDILEDFMPAAANRLDELMVKTWKLQQNKYRNLSDAIIAKVEDINQKFTVDVARMKETYTSIILEYDSLRLKLENKRDRILKLRTYTDTARLNAILDSIKNLPSIRDHKLNAYLATITTSDVYKAYQGLVAANKNEVKVLLTINSIDDFEELIKKMITDTFQLSLLQPPATSKSKFVYIVKIAEFLTDAMTATNSKQLANVIEAYASPANSYKIKRSSRVSFDLNAYVGAFSGVEFIKERGVKGNSIEKGSFVYGLSVPVGITASWGSTKKPQSSSSTMFIKNGKLRDLNNNCFSLSFTIIDLAAVVVYRLENGENGSLPKEVKWAQILSPGAHARWGIRNTPLCFSAGVQFTPELRNFSETGIQKKAWRAYTGLFFDLPLFNIYRR